MDMPRKPRRLILEAVPRFRQTDTRVAKKALYSKAK